MIELLDWDSVNFNFKVGEFKISARDNFNMEVLKSEMFEKKYKLVYLYSNKKLNLEAFYDIKLVYGKERTCYSAEHYADIKFIKGVKLSKQILHLSLQSGKYSRFHLDIQFPEKKFHFLYRKWIENSLYTNFATDVLGYEINNEVVGLLTYKITDNQSSIGIIVTDKKYQGKGIGTLLMKCYESVLPKNIFALKVITQGINITARKFYEKNGYSLMSTNYVYHIWA